MALVHKQPVNAKLFKSNHIIFSCLVIQFFQFCFQCFLCLFHLLDRILLSCFLFCRLNRKSNICNLILQQCNLSFSGKWNFLELAVCNDNCIIITSCDSGTKPFSVCRFKIFLRCHQNICSRIQA